jgi:hypothetical protein
LPVALNHSCLQNKWSIWTVSFLPEKFGLLSCHLCIEHQLTTGYKLIKQSFYFCGCENIIFTLYLNLVMFCSVHFILMYFHLFYGTQKSWQTKIMVLLHKTLSDCIILSRGLERE